MEQIYILELKMMAIDKCSQRVSLKKIEIPKLKS